ncbi:MAG: phage integrase central domain-containing protein, partial [Gemmobacter sp.]
MRPVWGDRRVDEITRKDVVALLDEMVDRGAPIGANRMRALLKKMFS